MLIYRVRVGGNIRKPDGRRRLGRSLKGLLDEAETCVLKPNS